MADLVTAENAEPNDGRTDEPSRRRELAVEVVARTAALWLVVCPRVVRGDRVVRGHRCPARWACGHRHSRDQLRDVGHRPRSGGLRLPSGEPPGLSPRCTPLSLALGWDRRNHPDRARGCLPVGRRTRTQLPQRLPCHEHLVEPRRRLRPDRVDRLRRMARPHDRGRRVVAGGGTRALRLGARDADRPGVSSTGLDVRPELLPPPGPPGDGMRALGDGLRPTRAMGGRRDPRRPGRPVATVRAARGGAPPPPGPGHPEGLLRWRRP